MHANLIKFNTQSSIYIIRTNACVYLMNNDSPLKVGTINNSSSIFYYIYILSTSGQNASSSISSMKLFIRTIHI